MPKVKKIGKNYYKKITPKVALKDLDSKLWRIFGKYIRKRDRGICYTCGKPGNQAGHYISQGSSGTLAKFNEKNVHCQCVSCNHFKSGNLRVYGLNLERDYGFGILQELEELKNKTFKADQDWYEVRILIYSELLNNPNSLKDE